MKQMLLVASALMLMSAATSKAQVPVEPNNPQYENYIQVTGYAEKEVVPDEIYMSIEINENDTKGKISVDKLEQDMIAKLKSIGVDIDNDLIVDGMGSELKKFFIKKNQARTSASYELKVNSTAMLGKAYQALQDIGISTMDVVRTDHSQMTEFTNEMRIEAMKDAKKTASALAQAVGQEAGRAVYIIDYNNRPVVYRESALYGKAAGISAMDSSNYYESPLGFKKIKISYSITAKFELK